MHTSFNRILSTDKVNAVIIGLFLLPYIIVFAGLLWITGFPLPYLLNNYRINSFADQLNKIPLPPLTQRASSTSKKFGNLGPCGKHGDYYADFKIASTLSLPQLERFYKQFHVQVPEINDAIFSSFRGLGTHGPQTIDVEKIEGVENNYLVSVLDLDYWPNDHRCW